MKYLRIPVVSAFIIMSLPSQALAQDKSDTSQEEAANPNAIADIVVTARRSNESLMSVPVAVTAISAADVAQAGATNLEEISQLAPQVSIGRTSGGSGGIISIRGLGTPFGDAGLDQSVSVNIDGVQVGRSNIVSQGFFDLGQVEVLKGPQALFFGKNSPAGVISLRSVNPTDKLEGFVRGGYEFVANERYAEAAIGGPITDTLKARVAVRGMKMDGFVKNTAPTYPATLNGVTVNNPFYPGFPTYAAAKRNGGEELLGRVTVLFNPSNTFDATLKVSGGRFKDNGPVGQAYCPNTPLPLVNLAPFVPTTQDQFGDCSVDDRYQNAAIDPRVAATIGGAKDGKPFSDAKSLLGALTMNYHASDDITITSVTGLVRLDSRDASSSYYSSFGILYSGRRENTKTLSQEIRVQSDFDGPLNFMFGGFYEKVDRTYDLSTDFTGSLVKDPVTGRYTTYDNFNDNHGKTYSSFAQFRWKMTDQLELAGGARYTYEKKDITAINTYVNPVVGPLFNLRPAGLPQNLSFRDNNVSPEVTLSWTPRDGTLIYAAYKTGYKSGGASNPSRLSANTPNADLIYGPEKSKGGEIGIKSYLANRTVRIETTAYSYLYNDLQVSSFDVAANNGTGASRITNAASARIKGVEFSGEWRPVAGLRLTGQAVHNIAKFKSFPNATCYQGQPVGGTSACQIVFRPNPNNPNAPIAAGTAQSLAGMPLTRAPKWVFMAGASYDTALTSDLTLGINTNANRTSGYYTQDDYNPDSFQRGFWLLNGGVKLSSEHNGWEIGLNGRNLANKYYRKICGAKFIVGQYQCGNIRTREVTLQLGYKF